MEVVVKEGEMSEEQKSAIKNIKTLYESGQKVIKFFNDYSKIVSEAKYKTIYGWVLVYELTGCGVRSTCSHLKFRFCVCFEQGVPWHSGHYRMRIHSETVRDMTRTYIQWEIECLEKALDFVFCWKYR